uniref:hypothetical protein n=1 Tax=Polyopes affinis TaxID=194519 RepID=UPI0020288F51|nr:hypothetical protein NDC12_mgp01 [Polyopes affinis]UQJ72538.1 hypothetical protein [Polyopes affinis]
MIKTYQTGSKRANSSYHYLAKFDGVDNILDYNSYQFDTLNLNKIFIKIKLNHLSKIELLTTTVLFELLTQQRPLLVSSNKFGFSKFYNLKVTMRKNKILAFLDPHLPNIFLTSTKLFSSLVFKPENINKKLHIFSSNQFVGKLNYNSNSIYSIRISNYLNQGNN